jgi:hypothetical protein
MRAPETTEDVDTHAHLLLDPADQHRADFVRLSLNLVRRLGLGLPRFDLLFQAACVGGQEPNCVSADVCRS